MNTPFFSKHDPITVMADGTIKQVNPFSGTQVWTVPGRGNRPLSKPKAQPLPLNPEDFTHRDSFGSGRMLDTPPEKSRIVRDSEASWRILRDVTPEHLHDTTAEFRRVSNLFEIVSYDYWRQNYGYVMDAETRAFRDAYLAAPGGREHVLATVRTKLRAAGRGTEAGELPEEALLELGDAFFAGGHDLIIARRHYVDGATTDDQLCSSGELTPDEHGAFLALTVDSVADIYRHNRYTPYVAVFQNWLSPAGASFEHLHKQLVAIDERGVQGELEIEKLRRNFNMYNEMAVDYAGYHNLIIAENQHAVCFAGFGHRFPTLEIYSKSATPEPWLQDPTEVRGMSDLIHACHLAAGPSVPCNEEWHYKPIDLDLPMPWRVMIKWRVSTLAGFEGGTKIYVNTLSPENVRDRVTTTMRHLRETERIAPDIRIGMECSVARNSLRYNPLLP